MWRRGSLLAARPYPLLFSCFALLALAEASGRIPGGRLYGPRMDYDEWTPLGRGDPLKNDPTYDYVPPVLERVHYWVDPKEAGLRRENSMDPFVKFVESPLPVPPTMLVPPPYQPPPPPSPPHPQPLPFMSTTPAVPAALLSLSSPSSSYSSLNPFHHFEDHPVVTNIRFEERPALGGGLHFESPVVGGVFEEKPLDGKPPPPPPPPPLIPREKPLLNGGGGIGVPVAHMQVRPPASGSVTLFEDKPTSGGKVQPTANTIRFEDKPVVNKVYQAASAVNTTAKPTTAPPARRPQNASSSTSFATEMQHFESQKLRPAPSNVIRNPSVLSVTSPPPPSTSSSLALPPKPTTASPLRDNAIPHQEAATTVSTLTTDPLFSHYKQPASPVNGPPYLIIQGHSKVKTYGPSKPTSIHGIPVHAHGHAHNAIRSGPGKRVAA